MIASNEPVRILVVGGGFGGVHAAWALDRLIGRRQDVQITLLSRDNYFLMTPLLFEASSGILEPRHTVEPIRRILSSAHFVEAEVERIDLSHRIVYARPSPDEIYVLPYDHLVLSLGGVTNRALIPGSEHAMTFKTLADAIFLRNYVIDLFERAEIEQNAERKRALLTFVIIGGGLVGVELLGELTVFTRNLCRFYPHVDPAELRFELLESGPVILREMDRRLSDYAARILSRRGVRIRVSCPAKSIDLDFVRLPSGEEIHANTIILSAGVAPNPLLKDLPLEKDRKGRIATDATMRSRSHPNVWALGDCANIPDPTGQPYPQLAQHALREARVVARNVIATLEGRPAKPFIYKTLGTLAALGHYKGVGSIMGVKIRGFLAWWIWRTYYLMQMPRWERRIRIALDWTVALFFQNDSAKLDLFGEEHPLRKYELRRLGGRRAQEEVIGSPPGKGDGQEIAAGSAMPEQPGQERSIRPEPHPTPAQREPDRFGAGG